jgi:hypothetical protein
MMFPPRPPMMPPMPGAPSPMGGPMPMGAPMGPPNPAAPFEPPMSPGALQRQALLQMLSAPPPDPNGGLPPGTTMPKPYAPPTSQGARGRVG